MLKSEYLEGDNIIDIVDKYIDNKICSYAIMIDGEWGCGKSFFVKNTLKPYLETKIANTKEYVKIIYVSLYGITNVNDISIKILFNTVGNERSRKIHALTKSIMDAIGQKVNISIYEASTAICDLIDIKKYILILDDLERCYCPVSEVLGFVNNLVEHYDTKVIFIANESEIEKNDEKANPVELLVAKDMNILAKCSKSDNNQERPELTPEHLRKRAEEIFVCDSYYERVKEKLIAHTIKYRPDLKKTICEIIDKHVCKDTKLYQSIVGKVNSFVKILDEENYYNLRTFKFFLEIITRIDAILYKEYTYDYTDVIDEIIDYTFKVSLRYKKGNYKNPWRSDELYGKVSLSNDPYMMDSILGFAFVDEAIFYNRYNRDFIINTIKEYRKEKDFENKCNDPSLLILEKWFMHTENEVDYAIRDVNKKICEDKYDIKQYPNIIYLLLRTINECDFKKDRFDEIIEKVLNDIREKDVVFTFRDYRRFIDDDNVSRMYNEYMDTIQEILKKKSKNVMFEKIENALNSDEWGKELLECNECFEYTINDKSILGTLDMTRILDLVKGSESRQIIYFMDFIGAVYHFSNLKDFYKGDAGNIKILLEGLQEMDTEGFDSVKRKNMLYFIKLLKNKYQNLSV